MSSSSDSSDWDSDSSSDSQPSTPNVRFARRPTVPSSPPETPTTSSFPLGEPPHPASRPGMRNFSRPLPPTHDEIRPVGQGHNFTYIPQVRLEDLSPRSSTSSSSRSSRSNSPARSIDSDSDNEHPTITQHASIQSPLHHSTRSLIPANFTLSSLHDTDSDDSDDDDLSVILPDHYSDAASSRGAPSEHSSSSSTSSQHTPPTPFPADTKATRLADEFELLACAPRDDHDAWMSKQRLLKRMKRLSSGSIHKRTLSQSIGSETDDEDIKPYDANEIGASASGLRRLRRKTGERLSLIFDDPPQRIVECEEPESGEDEVVQERIPDMEEMLMLALPYYEMDTDMGY
ncbi:hypothetical protein V501_05363 [Pseudogymnoascus sp. VKM F-4519 (FW-2642)]|nr:hypothetical protein V501_05363 [Pseudogymnoascus sp. VKM F-4519 (FW-2642)]